MGWGQKQTSAFGALAPVGILTVPVASEPLSEALARQLLDLHRDALPDLSGLIVLVPNHRAGQDFARALAHAAGARALVPPRITPLKAWAESAADGVAEPHSQRLARLHGVLRQQAWLGQVDKWALAQELLTLADELSAARLGGEIAGRIRALHADTLDRAALNRETALIEAVWRTLNQDDSDPQARYARALRALAQQASAPLYAYALGPLTAVEKRFFEGYAERAPVQFFVTAEGSEGVAATLHAAWQTTEPPLKVRASALAAAHPDSPLRGHLKLCPAAHLEAEARSVATWVAEQLQAGRRQLALIALDRETSRRTRALLERMQVLVSDETGWTLSTTTAAAVIDRWLSCVADDFPHTELLDLLKSPFVLGDLAERQEPVLALEGVMRKFGIACGMRDIQRAARADSAAAQALPWLDLLSQAARSFSQSRAPLHGWLTRLLTSLEQLAALPVLRADGAGAAMLNLLDQFREELANDRERYNFNEWRRWLDMALENASFMDTGVSSPIVLTSLPAARGRVFEAVAIIGADAQHLPARATPGLFSQSIRAQLGLATAADNAAQTTDDLLHLLTQGPALISWQAWRDDEPNPASPLVVRLQALHQAAWQHPIEIQPIAEPPVQTSDLPTPSLLPAPTVPLNQLPRRYSPTAYQTLLDCPYRFYARYVLGLRLLDEAEEVLDKSDYGNALHRILKRFHDAAPPEERDAALSLLDQLSEAEFAALPAYTAADWRIKWRAIQPAYIDAWLAAMQSGWRFESAETDVETELDVPSLGKIVLHGRIDRIDRKGEALQVIDYKTTATKTLEKKRDAPGENIQLAVYAYLCNAAAAFLPINEDAITPVALDGETDVEAIVLRLPLLLEALVQQTGLIAHGVDAVCQYCEVRGLCRKGMWEAQHDG
jgi:ATP-dependent helicase/nuclease subunit B